MINLFILLVSVLYSQDNKESTLLEFKFKKGDTSRILSTVDENVYINGVLTHQAKILNRIFSKIIDVDEYGTGTNEATFMTTETTVGGFGNNFSWGEEYYSVFSRNKTGQYKMSDEYFMPTVRNVPVFPNYSIKKGDEWISDGYEVHDLRKAFNIEQPFKVPFSAKYKYVSDVYDETKDKYLNLIEVNYEMYFESPKPTRITQELLNAPAVTMGQSFQKIWWDNKKGVIDHYSEDFKIIIETFYGDQITFAGKAHAEVTEFQRVGTEDNLKKINDSVKNLGYEDVAVTQDERGVTISIENIQFQPDSSILMESEKEKIKKISEILNKFNNDLLVTGHCADRGSLKMQQKISEDRAIAVAEYLSILNVRNPNCIFTEGKGATSPISPNSTEDGRSRNRRVEITIMDK